MSSLTFLQLAWQVQLAIIVCITALLLVVAVYNPASGNIITFLSGLKKLFAVTVKPYRLLYWLSNLLKGILGIKQ